MKMPVPAWIDQLRDQLLATEAELRRLVRKHHHDPPPIGSTLQTRGARGGRGITIGTHEARTLLRAAMPVPMAARHKREAHAAMVAALAGFAAQLLDLNDPYAGPGTIAGALDLADSLHHWARRMRWHQAAAAAGANWPAPRSVTALLRQSPGRDVPALFDAPAAATTPAPRQPQPAAKPWERPRRKPRPAATPAQGSLLLPLPGRAPIAASAVAGAGGQAPARRAG
jgi:hypothetical protein